MRNHTLNVYGLLNVGLTFPNVVKLPSDSLGSLVRPQCRVTVEYYTEYCTLNKFKTQAMQT